MAKEPLQQSEVSSDKEFPPTVLIFDTPEEVDQYAVTQIIDQVQSKPDSVLTLPTGSTPSGMYRELVRAYSEDHVDFSHATAFNLDEYWPIRRDHPSSYNYYMLSNLFNFVNIPPDHRFIPNGESPDPTAEAGRYELLLQQYGPVDLAVLGIGPGTTAHIGFNEQGSRVDSRTRYMPLDEQTKTANSAFFNSPQEVPTGSITQGVADILDSRRILLLAKGEGKAWGINRALNGAISSDAPASFLRLHPNVTFVLDKAAAKMLATG